MRNPGTDRGGRTFGSAVIQAVWSKARISPGVDPAVRRKDACGAWIDRAMYGVVTSNGTGWEIDHVLPVARGGSDDIANLQALQWQNNRAKGDSLSGWSCAVAATS